MLQPRRESGKGLPSHLASSFALRPYRSSARRTGSPHWAPSQSPLSPGPPAHRYVVDLSAAIAAGALKQEGRPAETAALSAMTHPRQPTLSLLTLNVNSLQERDRRDVILSQETNHRSSEKGAAWVMEGPKWAPLRLERASDFCAYPKVSPAA